MPGVVSLITDERESRVTVLGAADPAAVLKKLKRVDRKAMQCPADVPVQKVVGGQNVSAIFVRNLAPDVIYYCKLQETFRSRYGTVKGPNVVRDAITGRSKGYGFVRFGDEAERNRAMTEMNGVHCSSRQMQISAATPKKGLGPIQQPNPSGMYTAKSILTSTIPVN
jgi:RNA recognition motif-containing protein